LAFDSVTALWREHGRELTVGEFIFVVFVISRLCANNRKRTRFTDSLKILILQK